MKLPLAFLATSVAYHAARRVGGHTCAPIIDPRNGRPSRQSHSISVQARTSLLAGADATAPILRRYRATAWVVEGSSFSRNLPAVSSAAHAA